MTFALLLAGIDKLFDAAASVTKAGAEAVLFAAAAPPPRGLRGFCDAGAADELRRPVNI